MIRSHLCHTLYPLILGTPIQSVCGVGVSSIGGVAGSEPPTFIGEWGWIYFLFVLDKWWKLNAQPNIHLGYKFELSPFYAIWISHYPLNMVMLPLLCFGKGATLAYQEPACLRNRKPIKVKRELSLPCPFDFCVVIQICFACFHLGNSYWYSLWCQKKLGHPALPRNLLSISFKFMPVGVPGRLLSAGDPVVEEAKSRYAAMRMAVSCNGGTPIAGWFTRENTIKIWMMTGGTPISGSLQKIKTPVHGPISAKWKKFPLIEFRETDVWLTHFAHMFLPKVPLQYWGWDMKFQWKRGPLGRSNSLGERNPRKFLILVVFIGVM